MKRALVFLLLFTACASARAQAVRFVDDEAQAVLAILGKRRSGLELKRSDWARVFASEGYRRLQQRELAMGREFGDDAFRDFVLSDALLARHDELAKTLSEWKKADLTQAAAGARAYLPKGAAIKAKVYPVIKPKTNSFVFELDRDPAIFVYLEPLPRDVFEGIVAHEFHHVGYAAACSKNTAWTPWLSAFGEGLATLAAAGGPGHEPRLRRDALEEWHRQLPQLSANFEEARKFLESVKRGDDKENESKRAMALFGIVGPWYTVGWHMATVIESELGRPAVIDAFCKERTLLAVYNEAAARRQKRTGEPLPLWPEELVIMR